jgi:hypothetical protein
MTKVGLGVALTIRMASSTSSGQISIGPDLPVVTAEDQSIGIVI